MELQEQGRKLEGSFADVLDNPPSRIFACFTSLGRMSMADEGLVHEMVRLAFDNLGIEETKGYLHEVRAKIIAQ